MSRSGGLIPLPGEIQPKDHGFLAWTFDPQSATGGQAPPSGTLYVALLRLNVGALVSNVTLFISTAGVTLTAGESLFGLYTKAGALLSGSADQSGVWTGTGIFTAALTTPQQCAAGDYYVALYSVGTTPPVFGAGAAGDGRVANAILVSPNLRSGFANAGLTNALPANLSAMNAQRVLWAAIS